MMACVLLVTGAIEAPAMTMKMLTGMHTCVAAPCLILRFLRYCWFELLPRVVEGDACCTGRTGNSRLV